jgi:hypothetical protein
MTSRSYSRETSASEFLGLFVGGAALLTVLSVQVAFVAWML